MLDKLKNITDQISQRKNGVTFDAARFNDPIAEQVNWTVIKAGGSNFQTHKLVEAGSSRIESEPTLISKIFPMIFVIMGLAIPLVLISAGYLSGNQDLFHMSFASVLFGLIFVGVGAFFFRKLSEKMIFDKLKNRFWVEKPGKEKNMTELMNNELKLSDVHAIQLVSKFLKGNNKSFYIYEMNVVMNDTQRYNVMRHGKKRQIRRDAAKLSKFMGKPIWDAAD
ncbi:hypothetical protein DYD21_11915 [Rhodohalobacter sp. SW132]|uniref:hypothetical protein n=1 Tax=Rhodohalobacter sp. SW132 TaxID=2293433 RepID=UPI000E22295F|nr:hypothetical protein [Rhodohalobacter sp. SW132]REL33469.1 hypothetical protein DYD21_11915 [Rhodohalobacter sp. SW132]